MPTSSSQTEFALLALETSTERLSLALRAQGSMTAREVDAGQRHSDLTLPLLRELIAAAETPLIALDAIAFGQGPGSFTGVRIACALAQGMAVGLGKPLVPVPTQMALAEQCFARARHDHVVVALDARMGEIYFAAYSRSQVEATGWQEVVAPMLAKPGALPALGGDERHTWAGIGSAFDTPALADALRQQYRDAIAETIAHALPSAADVVAIAHRLLAARGMEAAVPAEQALPLYLRNHVAMTIAERRAFHAAKEAAPDVLEAAKPVVLAGQ